jgi:hypothetical protein
MDMIDPQPTLVELLVRHVLLPCALLPQIEINSIVHGVPRIPHPRSEIHNPLYRGHAMLIPALPYGHDASGVKTFMPCRIPLSINDWNFIAVSSSGSVQGKIISLVNDSTVSR